MFRTELHPGTAGQPLSLSDRFLTIGSCFSECMGRYLQEYKLTTLANPFGTVFNPASIHKLLRRAIREDLVSGEQLTRYQEIWSHYDFHSSLSDTDPSRVIKKINSRIRSVGEYLAGTNVLMITYGTAFVYRLRENHEIVSNCHKHPGHWFTRTLLEVEEIVEDFRNLQSILPDKRFILTVSPVRHTRDTLTLNSVSKSILRLACHKIAENMHQVDYFPSFELMYDDLRDYRFYDRDLIHPTPVAEDYIWKKFTGHYFSETDQAVLDEVCSLNKRLHHRPGHPGSAAHRDFLEQLLTDLEEMNHKVDFRFEIEKIRTQLTQQS